MGGGRVLGPVPDKKRGEMGWNIAEKSPIYIIVYFSAYA